MPIRGRTHRDSHDAEAEQRIEDELRGRGRHFLDAWERVVDRVKDDASDGVDSAFVCARSEGKSVMYMATDDPAEDLDERRIVDGITKFCMVRF